MSSRTWLPRDSQQQHPQPRALPYDMHITKPLTGSSNQLKCACPRGVFPGAREASPPAPSSPITVLGGQRGRVEWNPTIAINDLTTLGLSRGPLTPRCLTWTISALTAHVAGGAAAAQREAGGGRVSSHCPASCTHTQHKVSKSSLYPGSMSLRHPAACHSWPLRTSLLRLPSPQVWPPLPGRDHGSH